MLQVHAQSEYARGSSVPGRKYTRRHDQTGDDDADRLEHDGDPSLHIPHYRYYRGARSLQRSQHSGHRALPHVVQKLGAGQGERHGLHKKPLPPAGSVLVGKNVCGSRLDIPACKEHTSWHYAGRLDSEDKADRMCQPFGKVTCTTLTSDEYRLVQTLWADSYPIYNDLHKRYNAWVRHNSRSRKNTQSLEKCPTKNLTHVRVCNKKRPK